MERERDQLSVTTDTSIISTASLFAQLVLAILAMQAQRHDDSSTAVDVIGTLVLHVAESLQIHTDIGHLQGGCGDGVWASQLNEIYSAVLSSAHSMDIKNPCWHLRQLLPNVIVLP